MPKQEKSAMSMLDTMSQSAIPSCKYNKPTSKDFHKSQQLMPN